MIRAQLAARVWQRTVQSLVDGRWHTLSEVGAVAGVAPQVVRAVLRQWVRMGAPIQQDSWRGLRFAQPVTPLRCKSQRVSVEVDDRLLVDSTNTLALQALGDGLAQRKVWVAEYQTQGRGRALRQWHQGLGCGLSLSLAIPAAWALPPDALSLRVGVALAEALQGLGVRDVQLKWPNDVLWQGKKLGGILIEARRAGVVIGIGLNQLRHRQVLGGLAQPAASLQDVLGGRVPGRARVLAAVVGTLLRALTDKSAAWRAEFGRFDALCGRAIRVYERDGKIWNGVAEGVDEQGYLRVRTEQGMRLCHAAEVSVRVDVPGDCA